MGAVVPFPARVPDRVWMARIRRGEPLPPRRVTPLYARVYAQVVADRERGRDVCIPPRLYLVPPVSSTTGQAAWSCR
jgi:hypothetical protein